MKKLLTAAAVMSVLMTFAISEAVETKLIVRARSKDAKFVGTGMGGAMVVIKDSDSGIVLADGFTIGGTGNTQKIMIEPKTRFGAITGGAAKFEASIDIDEPRLITIEVSAPYKHRDNMIKSSTQMWLIPGRDVLGEGVIVEIPGFSVDAESPQTVKLQKSKAVIPIQARIVMI